MIDELIWLYVDESIGNAISLYIKLFLALNCLCLADFSCAVDDKTDSEIVSLIFNKNRFIKIIGVIYLSKSKTRD